MVSLCSISSSPRRRGEVSSTSPITAPSVHRSSAARPLRSSPPLSPAGRWSTSGCGISRGPTGWPRSRANRLRHRGGIWHIDRRLRVRSRPQRPPGLEPLTSRHPTPRERGIARSACRSRSTDRSRGPPPVTVPSRGQGALVCLHQRPLRRLAEPFPHDRSADCCTAANNATPIAR